MSGGGAGSKADDRYDEQVELSFQQATNDWEYNWDTAQRGYNQQIIQNATARYNQEESIGYQEATQKQAWKHQMQIREMKYNSDVAAFNKSEKLYGAQVGYNQVAANLAYENENNVTLERYTDLEFKAIAAQQDYQSKKYSSQRELNTQRAKSSFESQNKTIEKIQALGKARSRGTEGRSARKQVQSIKAGYGMNTAAMYDALTRTEGSFNENMAGLDASLLSSKQQGAQAQMSIERSYNSAYRKIGHDQYGSNLRADAQRLSMPTMGPALPKPLEMPRAIINDPMLPINSKAPVKGASSGGVGAAQDRTRQNAAFGSLAGMAAGAALSMIPGIGTAAAMGLGASGGGILGSLF
tara:strand:+ start:752 stop:1813 length:1062 start_codon:yes stop_codon:yes gene_type:complete